LKKKAIAIVKLKFSVFPYTTVFANALMNEFGGAAFGAIGSKILAECVLSSQFTDIGKGKATSIVNNVTT
jgi:hypothetical protein